MENKIKSLIRKVKYFNKKAIVKLNESEFNAINSLSEYNKKLKKFEKAKKDNKFNIEKLKLEEKYNKFNHTLPNIKNLKDLQKAKEGLSNISKEFKEQNLSLSEVDEFIQRVREYNKKLTLKQNSNRIRLLPRTKKELDIYNKVLDNAKEGNIEKAKKLLSRSKNKSLTEITYAHDLKQSIKYKSYTYRDYIFYRTSLREAKDSDFPELEEVLEKGGISMLLELAKNGFTLIEYSNSFIDTSEVTSQRDLIIAKLHSVSKYVNDVNRKIILDKIKKYIKQ